MSNRRLRLMLMLGFVASFIHIVPNGYAQDGNDSDVADQKASSQKETPSDGPKNPPLHEFYGFADMEIYKLDDGIGSLRAADLNGDGRTDLAIANNRRSKVELFYQRKPDDPIPEEPIDDDDINQLMNPTRFRRGSVSSSWRIANLRVDDVTGDAKPDLVFFGDPKELVIFANRGNEEWDPPRSIREKEGIPSGAGLETGDLNSDGRIDVALLGESDIFVFVQDNKGELERPVRYSHAGNETMGLTIADLDGDGRQDLVLFGNEPDYPIAFRLQDPNGRLGPLQKLRMPAIRSLTTASILGRKPADLFVIQQVSNRLMEYRLESTEATHGEGDWLALTYAYPVPGKEKRRPLVVADIDGDGMSDIVAADPKSAQLIWYKQTKDLGLAPGETFPGLLKIKDMAAADVEGDGSFEVFLLSEEEKTIGMSKLTNGRLSFPKSIPVDGEPVAFAVGRCFDEKTLQIAYVSKEKPAKDEEAEDGEEKKEAGDEKSAEETDDEPKVSLVVQPVDSGSERGECKKFDLPKLKEMPSTLRFADVDQDGRLDILIFTPYEALTTVLQKEAGKFEVMKGDDAGLGLVKDAEPAGYCLADVTGDGKPEVLLAQKSFARALKVVNGQWTVEDQYSPSGSDVRIAGVAAIFENGAVYPRIVLYNADGKELHVLTRREDGTYSEKHSQPIGAYDLSAMVTAPLTGDGYPTVMLADGVKFTLLCPNRPPYRLAEESQFETKLKDSRFTDSVVGDINHDGRADVLVSDSDGNYVHVLTFDSAEKLAFALKFRVFETKSYRRGRGAPEPREMCIADVTGDGHNDVLLIAHDRILLYPAE